MTTPDIEALAERVADAIRYADGYVLTDFAVGLVKAGMAEAQKLPAAPRDAGERLTAEEQEELDTLLLGSANLDYLDLSHAAETVAKALARLTQKEPNNG